MDPARSRAWRGSPSQLLFSLVALALIAAHLFGRSAGAPVSWESVYPPLRPREASSLGKLKGPTIDSLLSPYLQLQDLIGGRQLIVSPGAAIEQAYWRHLVLVDLSFDERGPRIPQSSAAWFRSRTAREVTLRGAIRVAVLGEALELDADEPVHLLPLIAPENSVFQRLFLLSPAQLEASRRLLR